MTTSADKFCPVQDGAGLRSKTHPDTRILFWYYYIIVFLGHKYYY